MDRCGKLNRKNPSGRPPAGLCLGSGASSQHFYGVCCDEAPDPNGKEVMMATHPTHFSWTDRRFIITVLPDTMYLKCSEVVT